MPNPAFVYPLRVQFPLIFASLALAWVAGAAETISFEEPIAQPQDVRYQYCNTPPMNKGVIFLNGRIFEPTVQTSSPNKALYNDLGQEFDEFKTHT